VLLCAVKLLVALVSRIFPEFQFGWLSEEMRRNLPLELDFVHEARNCEKVAKNFAHLNFLKVNVFVLCRLLFCYGNASQSANNATALTLF